ncbi:hypothetical protein [Paenibacillus sanguinis]|uniref:hypothetical protein n=1 Tax=Paenibacillus sanguinis TaxID=225906 RepID=UPI00036842C1|nr:hypothetical protein [Paenibacillus sanguinis]
MLITNSARKRMLSLEAKEWAFLVQSLGMKSWPDHPFSAFLGLEELSEKALQEGRDLLESKGYLVSGFSGEELNLPPGMMKDVSAVLRAVKGCRLTYHSGQQSYDEYCHFAGDYVMRLECLSRNHSGKYNLERGGTGQICAKLADKMKWSTRISGQLPALLMSRKQYEAVLRDAPELELNALTDRLARITDDAEGSIALARSIWMRIAYGDIQCFTLHQEGWERQHIQFMNSEYTSWLIRSSTNHEEDWMIATPTPSQAFQEMLQQWLYQPVDL